MKEVEPRVNKAMNKPAIANPENISISAPITFANTPKILTKTSPSPDATLSAPVFTCV